MNGDTRARIAAIAAEIRELAFVAQKSKNPREALSRIHTLSREACDYYAFGLNAPAPAPVLAQEPEEFGFTCPERDCPHNDSETESVGFATLSEALDAAQAHRATHEAPVSGIVTTERRSS